MGAERVIVIGASADGLQALRTIVAGLPATLAAPVVAVLHIGARPSRLAQVLGYRATLRVKAAADLDELEPGWMYVAPPDRHVLVEPGRLRLSEGPREKSTRPSIDPLFRSAASAYGPAAIGVLLTGGGTDGAAGLAEIKKRGGVAIVQEPAEARFSSMPSSALAKGPVDHRVPVADIPALLRKLVGDCGTAPTAA